MQNLKNLWKPQAPKITLASSAVIWPAALFPNSASASESPSLGDVEENGFEGDHLLDPIALWATQGIDPHLSAQGVAQGAGKVGDPANVSHVGINRV